MLARVAAHFGSRPGTFSGRRRSVTGAVSLIQLFGIFFLRHGRVRCVSFVDLEFWLSELFPGHGRGAFMQRFDVGDQLPVDWLSQKQDGTKHQRDGQYFDHPSDVGARSV